MVSPSNDPRYLKSYIDQLGAGPVHNRIKAAQALGAMGAAAVEASAALVKNLEDHDRSVRRSAGDALVLIGKPALPALIQTLEDGHWYSLLEGHNLIESLGPEAEDAIPALVRAMGVSNYTYIAVSCLQHIGPILAWPILRTVLRNNEYNDLFIVSDLGLITHSISHATICLLDKMDDKAIPLFLDALHDKHEYVRWLAVQQVGKRRVKEAIPVLIEMLDQFTLPEFTIQVLDALIDIDSELPVIQETLLSWLRNPKVLELANTAIWRLSEIQCLDALPVLIHLLELPGYYNKCCEALAKYGSLAAPALPILISSMNKWVFISSGASGKLLHAIGEAALPDVVNLLYSARGNHRVSALEALLRKAVVPAVAEMGIVHAIEVEQDPIIQNQLAGLLDKLAKNQPLSIEAQNALTLYKIKKEEAQSPYRLVEKLHQAEDVGQRSSIISAIYYAMKKSEKQSPEFDFMLRALINELGHDGNNDTLIYYLGELGPAAAPAVSPLAAMLDGKKDYQNNRIINALADIGSAALPALIQEWAKIHAAKSFDVELRIILSIRKLGPDAWPALPLLIKVLSHPQKNIRYAASQTISVIGNRSVPVLIEALSSNDAETRLSVVWQLGMMGAIAHESIPVLEGFMNDADRAMRKAVKKALAQIHRVDVDNPQHNC